MHRQIYGSFSLASLALLALSSGCAPTGSSDIADTPVLPLNPGDLSDDGAADIPDDMSLQEIEELRALAADALAPTLSAHGLGARAGLTMSAIRRDPDGPLDVRVQQTFDGVPVLGGQAIVHLTEDGTLEGVTDNLIQSFTLDTRPGWSAEEAMEIGAEAAGGWAALTDQPDVELVILLHEGAPHLAWQVDLRRLDGSAQTAAPRIYVDARDGTVLERQDRLRRIAGTGESTYSGSVDIKIYKPSGSSYFYLENPSYPLRTLSMLGMDDAAIDVFDTDNDFSWRWQREAVDVHFAASQFLEYLSSVQGWNGLDGASGPGTLDSLSGTGQVLAVYANYGEDYNGAFWLDDAAWLGSGDGVTWGPLTSVDLVGHELGHGVTEKIAGFVLSGESGAIDEGYADILGAMAQRDVEGDDAGGIYKMGEDAYTPSEPYDAIRYLSDPSKDGVTIDHYDDLVAEPVEDAVNMGILTLAFYMLAEGENHPTYGGRAPEAIGAGEAELIAFRGLRRYTTSSTDFAGLRNAWLDAATDLHGADSVEYASVMDAWSLVGVGVSSRTGSCIDYDMALSGTMSAGGSKYYPSTKGRAVAAGNFLALLSGPATADFDLFLQRKASDGTWSTVASARTVGTAYETLTYTGTAGTYRLRVRATTGSGDFVACTTTP